MMVTEPKTDRELLILMNEKLDVLVTCKDDHENRIRNIEQSFWKVVGAGSFTGLIAGLVGGRFGGS